MERFYKIIGALSQFWANTLLQGSEKQARKVNLAGGRIVLKINHSVRKQWCISCLKYAFVPLHGVHCMSRQIYHTQGTEFLCYKVPFC